MVLFDPRDNNNTSHYRYARLLHPCSRTYHLFRHFRDQQHCLGFDRRTRSLGHELFADQSSTEHLRWHQGATSTQDYRKSAGHSPRTFGAGFWWSQGPDRADLQTSAEREIREATGQRRRQQRRGRAGVQHAQIATEKSVAQNSE